MKSNWKFRHQAVVDDVSPIEGIKIQRCGRDDAFFPTRSRKLRAGIFEINREHPVSSQKQCSSSAVASCQNPVLASIAGRLVSNRRSICSGERY